MTTTVRKLTVDDWKTLREVRLRSLADAPEAFYATYDDEAAFDEDRWRGRLADPDRVSLVAEQDGRVVGLVGAGPTSEEENDPDAAFMVGMWVEPDARGTGVAEALVDGLIEWCRSREYPRLVLWVYDAAPRAAAFYRRFGFQPTGRREDFDGNGRWLSMMSLDL